MNALIKLTLLSLLFATVASADVPTGACCMTTGAPQYVKLERPEPSMYVASSVLEVPMPLSVPRHDATGLLAPLRVPKPAFDRRPTVDRRFWAVMSVLGASKAFDMTTTAMGQARGCRETNPLLGPHPSNARIAAFGAGYFAGEVAVAYVVKRVLHNHRKLSWVWAIEPLLQTREHLQLGIHNIEIGCTR